MSIILREPVRVYIYGVLVVVLALLAALGKLDGNLIPTILSVAAAVLAVEKARASVSPVANEDVDGDM